MIVYIVCSQVIDLLLNKQYHYIIKILTLFRYHYMKNVKEDQFIGIHTNNLDIKIKLAHI